MSKKPETCQKSDLQSSYYIIQKLHLCHLADIIIQSNLHFSFIELRSLSILLKGTTVAARPCWDLNRTASQQAAVTSVSDYNVFQKYKGLVWSC